MNFSEVLEGASKAAAGVGVVLGMSYITGLFKTVGFYGEFHISWLFQMMDMQSYISAGLPLTALAVLIFAVYFFGMNRLKDAKGRVWVFLGSLTLGCAVIYFFLVLGTADANILKAAGILVSLAGAALAGWICHSHFYPSRMGLSFYNIFFALATMLAIGPNLIGQARAQEIKSSKGEITEVVDSENKVVGIVLGVVGGKLLVLDCDVDGQLSFHELTAGLKLRRSSGRCLAGR